MASVAPSVFMTSQLYRHLSALSVLSRYCGVVNACRLPPVIPYDTILMLFRSTSPLGDRASPPLSVSYLPPPSTPCFMAELNGPCVLRRIHTMRRQFGDRSAGGSVPSRADWIGHEPDSVLRSVRSLINIYSQLLSRHYTKIRYCTSKL